MEPFIELHHHYKSIHDDRLGWSNFSPYTKCWGFFVTPWCGVPKYKYKNFRSKLKVFYRGYWLRELIPLCSQHLFPFFRLLFFHFQQKNRWDAHCTLLCSLWKYFWSTLLLNTFSLSIILARLITTLFRQNCKFFNTIPSTIYNIIWLVRGWGSLHVGCWPGPVNCSWRWTSPLLHLINETVCFLLLLSPCTLLQYTHVCLHIHCKWRAGENPV